EARRVPPGSGSRSRCGTRCSPAAAARHWYWSEMSDANEQEQNTTEQEQKRPLTLGRSGGRLELRKPAEAAQVRQSFSHGRSKTVTVEVRKKRVISPGLPEAGRAEASPAVARDQSAPRPAATEPAARRPVVIARSLTAEERAGRTRAVQ